MQKFKETAPPRSIGIIGGAGPMAGVLLHQKIIQIAQKKYRCRIDSDFPLILHISYPFADMLSEKRDLHHSIVEKQLEECFSWLYTHKIQLAAIACNTLHAYLPASLSSSIEFIHLIRETIEAVGQGNFLVLCSSTSRIHRLHSYPNITTVYPSEKEQQEMDAIIDRIVAGTILASDAAFCSCCTQPDLSGVILGCTEISELHHDYPIKPGQLKVIDPLELLAEALCRKSFSKTDL